MYLCIAKKEYTVMKQKICFVIFFFISSYSYANQFDALNDAKNAVTETQQRAEQVDRSIRDAASGNEDSDEETAD